MSGARLPDAAWRHDPALRRVLDALEEPHFGRPRAVGGAVRDTLAGLAVTDVDLATPLVPEEVMRRLEGAGIKAVPTGIAHGTVIAVADHRPFEVTTLRRDVATDGRRATVAFAEDWAEDARRRDFTINALYADPLSGALFDPVGSGIDDLRAGRVRFIGDAATRIAEDHLRVLRWFRFDVRFGTGERDAATEAVIAAHAKTLRALSRERVADELLRLLALPDPTVAVERMARLGVLAEIAGEAMPDGPARLASLIATERAAGVAPDALRRLTALGPSDAVSADTLAARLRLSTRQRKHIAAVLGAPAEAGATLAYHLGVPAALDATLLRGDAVGAQSLVGVAPPVFPIKGRDLVARGVAAGPDIARLLKRIEREWIAAGFPDAAASERLIDDALAQAATAR